MGYEPRLDEIARLLSDRSRAVMLASLMDGREWTGRELARAANVTPATASVHLQRLVDGELIASVRHGRFRYYRIARPEIAQVVERLMSIAPRERPRHASPVGESLKHLRTCYDHLAGRVAVDLAAALVAKKIVRFEGSAALVDASGLEMLANIGIVVAPQTGRRPLCRPCLDWSERRYHIAGHIGSAIAGHALEKKWVAHDEGSRALRVSPAGATAFRELFGVDA